jgi:hypothetical protein
MSAGRLGYYHRSRIISRIKAGLCRQLFPQTLFLLANVRGDLNGSLDVKIPASGTAGGQALAPDAQFLSLLKTGGNPD